MFATPENMSRRRQISSIFPEETSFRREILSFRHDRMFIRREGMFIRSEGMSSVAEILD